MTSLSDNGPYGAGDANEVLAQNDSPESSTDLTPRHILKLTHKGHAVQGVESDVYGCLVSVTTCRL